MGLRHGLLIGLFLTVFTPTITFAGGSGSHYFESLRYDTLVPEHCQEVSLDHFETDDLETLFYGPAGAEARGFTHEYPIERHDAKSLWRAAQALLRGEDIDVLRRKFDDNDDLLRDLEIVYENYQERGFDFQSEGEILEILAIEDLQQQIGDDYYVYGSVYYQDGVAGELDLMIGRTSDCHIETIGEAKLGLKSLSKAHKQLERFLGFLRRHLKTSPNKFFDLTQFFQ